MFCNAAFTNLQKEKGWPIITFHNPTTLYYNNN